MKKIIFTAILAGLLASFSATAQGVEKKPPKPKTLRITLVVEDSTGRWGTYAKGRRAIYYALLSRKLKRGDKITASLTQIAADSFFVRIR
jgi:hypothetical protein